MAGSILKPSDVHQNAALTNLAVKYKNLAFVAEKVFPVINVKKESDKYYIFSQEELIDLDSLRAVGTEAREVEWGTSTGTYTAEEYALKYLVPDRIVANSDNAIRPFVTTTEKLTKWLQLGWERRVQTLAQNTANATSSATPTPKWDGTSPDIEANVDTAKNAVRKAAGILPSCILMNYDVKDYLKRDSTVRNLIRYTVPGDTLLRNGDLPPVLWNLEVIVAGAIYNTARQGQTQSLSDIWNDNVIVFYRENSAALDSLSLGYTFRVSNFKVRQYREEKRKGNFVEAEMLQDEKVVATACSYLITDTIQS